MDSGGLAGLQDAAGAALVAAPGQRAGEVDAAAAAGDTAGGAGQVGGLMPCTLGGYKEGIRK